MEPISGVSVTLVSSHSATPYSGMLPGLVAGDHSFEDAHIDLRKLCDHAGARFIQAEATGLDLAEKKILTRDRPPLAFDLLSINIGSTPRILDVPGAAEFALPVKPIEKFLSGWNALLAQASRPRRLVIVGAGAGGVELSLAAHHRLSPNRGLEIHLVSDGPTILPSHNSGVQKRFTRILRQRGLLTHLNCRIVRVEKNLLHAASGETIAFDNLFWLTQAAPATWLGTSGLALDAHGFISVNRFLQSVSHPFVFAAGDVASMPDPRPKSGVFAVRAGPFLAANLRRFATSLPLRVFSPQKNFLSLISTGPGGAVASRGSWSAEGPWVWRWKQWIDRRWMRRYQDLPTPPNSMRCGGCGAKVGPRILQRVLARLDADAPPGVVIGLPTPDDAAVLSIPPGRVSVQTLDFFRPLVSDPFVLGQIAATHALSDIFAMGAEPQSALALAVIPPAGPAAMEEELFQLLAGVQNVLAAHQCPLVGGHSSEGAEMGIGLAVNGLADPAKLLRKQGLRPQDVLILTKPLGTGTLFAAAMRGRADARWIDTAIASMLRSNAVASRCFLRHGATAGTDVSGFGLAGHLLEMTRASGVSAEIFLEKIPLLPGVEATLQGGFLSSLHPENVHSLEAMEVSREMLADKRFSILFDPQTSGGLLAGLPADRLEACLAELKSLGEIPAVIGEVRPATSKSIQVLPGAPGEGANRTLLDPQADRQRF